MTSQSMYGTTPMMPTMGPAAPTQGMATVADGLSGWGALVHPDNPLFWLGVVGVLTVGLASVAGRVRLGPASASVKLGKG